MGGAPRGGSNVLREQSDHGPLTYQQRFSLVQKAMYTMYLRLYVSATFPQSPTFLQCIGTGAVFCRQQTPNQCVSAGPLCAHHVPSMRPLCALYAPPMCPLCALYVPSSTNRHTCSAFVAPPPSDATGPINSWQVAERSGCPPPQPRCWSVRLVRQALPQGLMRVTGEG